MAWACFLGAALTLLAAEACPDTLALVGYGTTRGLGERSPAPEACLASSSRRAALEGSWYGAAKMESGRGWGARAATELRWRGLGAGASYTYRNGGAWTKSYPWVRVSAGTGPARLIAEAAVGGYNRERRLKARLTGRVGQLVVEPRIFVLRHLQGTGWGAAVFVGVALEGAR
jgi:hypothetical protein